MPAGAMTAAEAIQPAIDCAPRPSGSQPPRFAGFGDAQSPEEFLDRLETFCLVTGVAAEKRLTHVVPAALEGSAKLWLRFVKTFASWEDFKAAFIAEFSSIDAKWRLKQELELRTQHPEENLKEFIYTIAAYYDRIGGEVPEADKVDRVLRQMHPQLQDLVEGKQFSNLAELAKAADGLMERYWRRFQYKPPPPPTDQVARDLAFRPAANETGLSGAQPRVMAAAAAPFQHPSAASYWPLHPAAIQPSYHRDQLHKSPASAVRPHFPTPPQPQGYQPHDGGGITCHRCGGIGHMGREPAPLLPMQRNRTYPLPVPGKREAVGATPVSTYETAPRVAAVAGNREPLLEVRIGQTTFLALLDTGSSVSLLGTPAARVAEATGAKLRIQGKEHFGWQNRLVAVKHILKVQDTLGHKQPHPTIPVCARFVSGHCAWRRLFDCDRHVPTCGVGWMDNWN
ncbi:hypothetical protein HPB50_009753 [Hyalomma asiaticum]|uniref:Uncharacterized protein n=1 Tax=Hyalomma asiaticum TaxID=266040 RepID=A0ACB7S521_HYAAI|nr:hypothetical protein HPB50_009753 [Hyalomma asiaticum]